MIKLITESLKYRFVTQNFIKTSLGNKYKRSPLGSLWSILLPLVRYLIMGFVFHYVFNSRDPKYFPFFFTGMALFSFLSACIHSGTSVFLNNAAYIKKIYVPKLIFIANIVFTELINHYMIMFALIILGIFTGNFVLSWSLLFIIPAYIMIIMFLIGIICILGILELWFNDIKYFVDILMQTLYFITPIMFQIDRLPEFIYKYNPFWYFVELVRMPLVYGKLPDLYMIIISAVVALSSALLGLAVLKKFQNEIIFKL